MSNINNIVNQIIEKETEAKVSKNFTDKVMKGLGKRQTLTLRIWPTNYWQSIAAGIAILISLLGGYVLGSGIYPGQEQDAQEIYLGISDEPVESVFLTGL